MAHAQTTPRPARIIIGYPAGGTADLMARQLAEKGLKALRMTDEELIGHYIAEDLVDPKTGEIHAEAGEEITEKTLKLLFDEAKKSAPKAKD